MLQQMPGLLTVPSDVLEQISKHLGIMHLRIMLRGVRVSGCGKICADKLCHILLVGNKITSMSILRVASALSPHAAKTVCITSRFHHRFVTNLLEDVPNLLLALGGDESIVLSQGIRLRENKGKIHTDPACESLVGKHGSACVLPWSINGLRRQLCRRCYRSHTGWRKVQTVYTGNNLHQVHVNDRLFQKALEAVRSLVRHVRRIQPTNSRQLDGIERALEGSWPSLFSGITAPCKVDFI